MLLKNCTVYDGTGSQPFTADIGIEADTIEFIERAPMNGQPAEAKVGRAAPEKVIDLKGLCVSPGFIDTHGHSEFNVLREPPEAKIFQGVTTEINGNCGLSAAPLYGDALRKREGDLEGIKERWSTLDEYFRVLEGSTDPSEGRELSINFATLVGQGNIRASVMGYEARGPEQEEMKRMKGLLRESLEAGAIGLSTGLIYPPGMFSETEELIELSEYGGEISGGLSTPFIYTTHMRSEGQALIESLEEAIRIGREGGVRVHISHIKTAGRDNWHKIEEAVSLMDGARAEGISLTCDRYPYTAASTGLDAVLPAWAFEGGDDKELERLHNMRDEIKEGIRSDREYWKSVCISTVSLEKNRWMEGKSIGEISSGMEKDPVNTLFDILVDEKLRVEAIFHSMNEDNLKRFLSLPYTMVGSDSSARSMSGTGKPHPRGSGTFPRFLGRYTWVTAASADRYGEAVYKITMLPALTFGLKGRGQIKEGFVADMVVFDADKVIDMSTFDEPFLRPRGIRHVIVNGVPVLKDGELTGEKPGRVLRHGE
jgi:N-acyl-D-amino-acid deacylase